MGKQGFAGIYRFKGILGLCMWLVVVCLVIAGLPGCVPGGGPKIQSLTSDIPTLQDGGIATYSYRILDADGFQLTEAGNVIAVSRGPLSSTYDGITRGLPGNTWRAGNDDTVKVVLVATRGQAKDEKTLVLKFSSALPAKLEATADGIPWSDNRVPLWGPPTTAPVSPTSPASTATLPESSTTPYPPDFFKCPDSCSHCLTPDEAASLGFNAKCSDQPCYFSPNKDKLWYCYSEPAGYCCKRGPAGMAGQVIEATKSQCAGSGGDFWSLSEGEAIKACLPTGYCCREGQIGGPMTKDQCALVGGSFWSPSQAEVIQACQPVGYCCSNNQVTGPVTQSQCAGLWSTSQAAAMQACQPKCYCCVRPGTSPLSRAAPAPGRVFETTPSACAAQGGSCSSTMEEAQRACTLLR